ncbi:MAG: hypothetical protein VX899_21850 [Myxococcota bacterium]|nr:hypothetical protein [Myxococcota bacterium]
MIPLLTLLHTAQAQELQAVHTRTADIRALHVTGEVILAATAGGLEFYGADGTRLAHVVRELPGSDLVAVGEHQGALAVGSERQGAAQWTGHSFDTLVPAGEHATSSIVAFTQEHWVTRGGSLSGAPELEGLATDAVDWQGGVLVGTQEGYLHHVVDGVSRTSLMPCPVVDLYADEGPEGEVVRIACITQSFLLHPDGSLEGQRVKATAAGPGVFGTADGALVGPDGVIGRVPGRISAIERVGEAWFVGTQDGLYRLEQDLERLTPEGQICGNFVTGAAEFQGELVVTTFQRGACRFDGQRWHDIEGLPSTLVNDVVVYEGQAWFATSGGLAAWDGQNVTTFPGEPWGIPRGAPGTSNEAITALAVGSERLWIADVVGPDSVEDGYWRRHRLSVYGTSYQDVTACGKRAWVASEDAGVSQWTGRSWQHHDGRGGLPDDWVMAVACEGREAWAGTYDEGLWHYDGAQWSEIQVPDGWSLALARGEGGVWYGTLGGLFWVEDSGSVRGLWTPDPRVHQVSVLGSLLAVGSEGGLALYSL